MISDPESFNLLLDTIERFVRERLIPREQEVADTDAIPADIVDEMRRMGLFGLTIPEEYGGLGLTMEEEVLAAIALSRASPAFRSIMGTNNGIGSLGHRHRRHRSAEAEIPAAARVAASSSARSR